MVRMRILFCTSSVGLGHVTRDLSVSKAMTRINPSINIEWIAAEPALSHLKLNGINPLDVSHMLASLSEFVEAAFRNGRLKLTLKLILEEYRTVMRNYHAILEHVDLHAYDLIVLDEFWEVLASPFLEEDDRPPIVFLTDFLMYPYRPDPAGSLTALIFNRGYKRRLELVEGRLYVGYPDELPHARWFMLLGERVRKWAEERVKFTGYIPSFQPVDVVDAYKVRDQLGVGEGRLVVVTVGGTSAGSKLIDVAVKAYTILKDKLHDLYMVVVAGPRARPSIELRDIVTLGHIPDPYRYFAASDCVVARGGLSTISDVAVLNVPAVIVPMRGHYEQEERAAYVARKFPNIHLLEEVRCTPDTLSRILLRTLKAKRPLRLRSMLFRNQERAASEILKVQDRSRF